MANTHTWFCIPSARKASEANAMLAIWRERGYKIALWRDAAETVPPVCDILLTGKYPGYAQAVNALAAEVLSRDTRCEWIVTGGDDTLPDLSHSPEHIAAQCRDHFNGTFGVMQPTGDRFAGGSIDRIAGSPWMGREWCERANGGEGPLWPEFTHMFVDQCLQDTAIRCGAFWQRQDLIHLHRHFMRKDDGLHSAVNRISPPAHLVKWNSSAHWQEMEAIYMRLKRCDFAPCMPIAAVGATV
jgi:hypothetical protein